MFSIFKQKLFLIVVIEIFIFVVLLFSIRHTTQKPLIPAPPSPVDSTDKVFQEKSKWRKYFLQVGTTKGYKDFLSSYKNVKDYNVKHASLHSIGEILFEIDGVEGIKICDDTFFYACYHGFFGKFFQSFGVSNIKAIDKFCIEKTGPNRSTCSHGMGQGIQAYFDKKNLAKTLDTCDQLTYALHARACKNGAFTEYNFSNFTAQNGGMNVRLLDTSSPYSPCSELEEKHQNICYFSQPEWWNFVYKKDYKKIGSLCERLTDSNRENCYFGMGNTISRFYNFNLQTISKSCDAVMYSEGNMLCKVGAIVRYKLQPKEEKLDIKAVNLLCDSVESSLKGVCLQKSQLHEANF